MQLVDLLAKSDDIAGIIGFCVFAALVVFVVLAKAISQVSPEAMARKIRELQGQREGARPAAARYEKPVYAQVASPQGVEAPKKKRKKKRLAPVSEEITNRLVKDVRPPSKAPAAATPEGAPSLRQAVIYAELLAPPLALRRGPGRGLLRSAPWIR